jgi:hypothetical protein
MDLSVVVLSWNTRALTLRALAAARSGAEGLAFEVLCVDNASEDGTAEAVAALPHVRCIRNERNLGFAAGNNRAMPHARGRHVCFLNSDAAPRPGSLAHLVRYLDAHPEAGLVAPRLVGADGRTQRAARGAASPWAFLHRYTPLRYSPVGRRAAKAWTRGVEAASPTEVASLSGACLVAPRDLLVRLGGFDQGYPFYFEDLDLCRRVAALGRRIVYVPDGPPVDHAGGAATAARGGPPRRELLEGLVRYARTAWGERAGRRFALAVVPGALALAMLEPPRLFVAAARRAVAGDGPGAAKALRSALSWLRLLERDGMELLRLLARERGETGDSG